MLLADAATRDPAIQLARAATSTAANYRAACLARSHAEFRSKIGLTLEEADESVYWLEYLREAALSADPDLGPLTREGLELTRILGASKRTSTERAKHRRRDQTPRS